MESVVHRSSCYNIGISIKHFKTRENQIQQIKRGSWLLHYITILYVRVYVIWCVNASGCVCVVLYAHQIISKNLTSSLNLVFLKNFWRQKIFSGFSFQPLVVFILPNVCVLYEMGLCAIACLLCVSAYIILYILYTTYYIYTCITYGSLSLLLPCLLFVDHHISPFCVLLFDPENIDYLVPLPPRIWWCVSVSYRYTVASFLIDVRALFEYFSWFHYFLFPKRERWERYVGDWVVFFFFFLARASRE
jgi:hypothetical protein